MLNSFRYTIKQAFGQVFRNKTMSIASVFSITAMLLIHVTKALVCTACANVSRR